MENQLQIIVKDSGLETSKANYILEKFQDYFKIADEWEKKAKTIVVTDASQAVDMQMARVGRLFLRDKRVAIEKVRKELKEQALREGKAIDGIANILKALIVPIEEYLEEQEKFVEIKAKEEAEKLRIETERKAEEERIAKEKAEKEEQERIRIENGRLKKEAEERERQMKVEREKAEAEKRIMEEKARKEREKAETEKKTIEEKAKREREEAERLARIEKEKAGAEKKAIEDRARREKEAAEKKARAEREQLEKILAEEKAKRAQEIECPYCHKRFIPGEES